MPFFHVSDTSYKQKRAGVRIQSITGAHAQMTFLLLDPGFVSQHSHPEEQIGYVLSGSVEIAIGEERMECSRGDGYAIPGATPHTFRVLYEQPAELIELFSPPKAENKL